MKYKFFSRKNGFSGGYNIRVYTSCTIEDEHNVSFIFMDMSGKQIVLYLENRNLNKIFAQLKRCAKQNMNWYYYPIDTVITDIRTLE